MLEVFTPPCTPTGSSSLLPAPPWHFAGRVLSVEVELDTVTADRFPLTVTGANEVMP